MRFGLAEAERHFSRELKAGTKEADRFGVLSSLIAAYEAKAWHIKAVDAVDASKMLVADLHISREKLAPAPGPNLRLSEFLNHRRTPIMAIGNRLHDELQIPASVLIRPYAMVPRAASGRKLEKVQAGRTVV
ncbi:hypothetical protein U1737_08275 [Sphingomonas sp. LB3N6]|uniref:helix-turn-helix domain-containing protein n=1 Tax=Sphingomonas fucosidasi TaxID=3096164 RepID=UPI002FC9547D